MSADTPAKPRLLIPALLVALVVPIVPMRVIMNWMHPPAAVTQVMSNGWVWALGAIVLIYVLAVERQPLSSVGLGRFTWKSLAWGVGASVVGYLFVGGVLIGQVLPRLNLMPHSDTARMIAALPLWVRFIIVVRAGFVEEFLFRGFGIERLAGITGNRVFAGALTLVSFTLAHISYFSVGQLVVAAGAGLVLTILYLVRRDLWANIISHFLTDAVSVLLM